jgi:hypothetical protein
MKRATILCLSLSISGTALAIAAANTQRNSAFPAFWQKFKTAVISGDKEAVSGLSRFPLGMSYGIRSIRNSAELRRRYREVFNEQTDAAQCFVKKKPEQDKSSSKRFSVACPDKGGDEVVIYEFELTKTGWKFVRLDNINE